MHLCSPMAIQRRLAATAHLLVNVQHARHPRPTALSLTSSLCKTTRISVRFLVLPLPILTLSLVDRGWRRSGTYCYKPDVAASCCPHHTIRLHVDSFSPSKSQRQLVNRFVRFIQEGGKEGEKGFGTAPPRATSSSSAPASNDKKDKKGKGKSKPFDLLSTLLEAETSKGVHDFSLNLEPSTCTDEKYALYKKYQMSVHGDSESKVTKKGFERFLCESPLVRLLSFLPHLDLIIDTERSRRLRDLSSLLQTRRTTDRVWSPRYPAWLCLERLPGLGS